MTEKLSIQKKQTPLEIALFLASKGFAVFPCMEFPQKSGKNAGLPEKRPYTDHGLYDGTTDETLIREYWKEHPKALIGIACGEASCGIVVVDLDKDKTKPDFLSRLAVEGEKELLSILSVESLPNTYTVQTWSGGLQLYFIATKEQLDEIPNHNKTISQNIDVKARGGYVIGSGSKIVGGIGDGREYTVINAVDILPLPDNIFQLIRKQKRNKASKTENKPTFSTVSVNKLHPRLQKYADDVLKAEIDLLANTSEGNRNGQLNTTAFNLGTLIAIGLLDENTVISKLEWACHQNHYIEDHSFLAFQKTVQSGLTDGKSNPRKLEPELEALFTREKTQVAQAGSVETPPQWETPVTFDDFDLHSIQAENLPPLLAEYCQAVAEENQVPLELPVSMTLAVGAIVSQGKFETHVRGNYREPCSLYMLCLLESANRKSTVVKACSQPLVDYEIKKQSEVKDLIAEQTSERKTLERIIDKKRNEAASKAKSREDRKKAIKEISELEKELPEISTLPRLLVDNVTPEAMAPIMAENNGCIGIMDGEGGIFNILAGQYNKGVPNLDLFLKAHTGEQVHIDRRLSASIVIPSPHLSLGLSVQPFVISDRDEGKAFRKRGLDARFLYAMPKSLLGRRDMEPEIMPEKTKKKYQNKIFSLLDIEWQTNRFGDKIPYTLELSPESYALWLSFSKGIEKQLKEGGEFDGMLDWGGKFCGAIIRLASILHIFATDKPQDSHISYETMNNAIALGVVYAEHSKAAYGLMGTNEANEAAKKILNWIREGHYQEFKEQACWQAVRGSYRNSIEPVKAGLAVLAERGYLRIKETPQRQGPGRKPAPEYIVNPATFEKRR